MKVDKQRIAHRFQQAKDSYEQAARIQLTVAQQLLRLLDEVGCQQPQVALEIGSCTGLLSQQLATHFPALQHLFINDLVADFESTIRQKLHHSSIPLTFLAGDIEQCALPAHLDLVISSSTLHWLHDLDHFIDKLAPQVRQGGYLAFSLYGPDNLYQIRETTGISLNYLNSQQLQSTLSRHFKLHKTDEAHHTLHFPSPLALLKHLNATGVNSLQTESWNRSRLNRFSHDYCRQFSDSQGVFLTYHPLYFIATKR